MTPDELKESLQGMGYSCQVQDGQVLAAFELKNSIGSLVGATVMLMPRQDDVVDVVCVGMTRLGAPMTSVLSAGAQPTADEPFIMEYVHGDSDDKPGATMRGRCTTGALPIMLQTMLNTVCCMYAKAAPAASEASESAQPEAGKS